MTFILARFTPKARPLGPAPTITTTASSIASSIWKSAESCYLKDIPVQISRARWEAVTCRSSSKDKGKRLRMTKKTFAFCRQDNFLALIDCFGKISGSNYLCLTLPPLVPCGGLAEEPDTPQGSAWGLISTSDIRAGLYLVGS